VHQLRFFFQHVQCTRFVTHDTLSAFHLGDFTQHTFGNAVRSRTPIQLDGGVIRRGGGDIFTITTWTIVSKMVTHGMTPMTLILCMWHGTQTLVLIIRGMRRLLWKCGGGVCRAQCGNHGIFFFPFIIILRGGDLKAVWHVRTVTKQCGRVWFSKHNHTCGIRHNRITSNRVFHIKFSIL